MLSILASLLIGLLLGAMAAVVVTKGFGRDISACRRAEAELRKSRDQLRERAERLARLTLQLTLTEQQERLRISRLLHDHLQQDMVAVKFHLAQLTGQDGLDQAKSLIDQAISTARTLTVDLNPPRLHQGSFGAALAWLAQNAQSRYGLQVRVQIQQDVRFAREEACILLFESVRELLLNVVKHASTKAATVTLGIELGTLGREWGGERGEQVLVRVADDGSGFRARGRASDTEVEPDLDLGLGLLAISERLASLNGAMMIASGAGISGSRITLRVPLIEGCEDPTTENRLPVAGASTRAAPTVFLAKPQLRILLADDHVMVRQALANLLNDEPDMQVVGEASDGFEAIEQVSRMQPDVVVMDFIMPDLDGLAATRVIRERWSRVRVIGLSGHQDERWAVDMLAAGAEAAISKADVGEELLDCLRGLKRI